MTVEQHTKGVLSVIALALTIVARGLRLGPRHVGAPRPADAPPSVRWS